jgi:FkbM family methyltransferase
MDLHNKFLRDVNDYWFHLYHPKAGDIVVDIGAGQGEDILAFSPAVGDRGRVFAVEANPAAYASLTQFCIVNHLRNVTALNVACSDRTCHLSVHVTPVLESTYVRPVTDDDTGLIVSGVRFDELRSMHNIGTVDLLKMNIEGAERTALPGCAETLENTRWVCIAAHDFRAERGDGEEFRTLDFVIRFLSDAGFEVTRRADDPRPYVRDHVHGRNRRFSLVTA